MSISRILSATAVGVVIGLLIAPKKGEETREELCDMADSWRNQFNRLLGQAEARVDDLRHMLDSGVSGLTDDARQRIRTILDEAGSQTQQQGQYDFKDEFRPL
jgi:gas vesicle protein